MNANGGINGRPIQYIIQTEQTDPAQLAAVARKLVESNKVVGLVGNTSIIDCSINHKYYEKKGLYVIASGIAPECYGKDTNISSVNMGPRYSSDGAVQYVIRAGVNKIVFDQSNVPGTDYIAAGPNAVAKAAKVPIQDFTDTVPIQDANSVALKLVAGGGAERRRRPELHARPGAADPPGRAEAGPDEQGQGVGMLDAVQLGLRRGGSRDGLGRHLRRQRRAEPAVGAPGPDSALYRQLAKTATLAFGLGSFSQMGFVEAKIATAALLNMKPPYTLARVNAAFAGCAELPHRHPLLPVVLREGSGAHPEQRGSHGHAEQRQDGGQGALLQDLRGRSGHRCGPRRREEEPATDQRQAVSDLGSEEVEAKEAR